MKVLSKKEFLENKAFYINEIKIGKIFIYPTDTLYGLGCDAKNNSSVKKIIQIKKRNSKPILIIVPSMEWIKNNTENNQEKINYMNKKIPGPYSFILKLKNKEIVSKYILQKKDTLGIRMPDSWFSNIIQESNLLFTSTSVNISGKPSAIKIKDISNEIISLVDYVIEDDNSLSGKGSTIIDLVGNKPLILRK